MPRSRGRRKKATRGPKLMPKMATEKPTLLGMTKTPLITILEDQMGPPGTRGILIVVPEMKVAKAGRLPQDSSRSSIATWFKARVAPAACRTTCFVCCAAPFPKKEPSMSFRHDFTILKTQEQLIESLGMEPELFDWILAFDPTTPLTLGTMVDQRFDLVVPPFWRHEIPKKNPKRGNRVVWAPTPFVKDYCKGLGRRLNNFFSHKLPGFPHPRAFGYINGLNIRDNAKDHCGHKNLVTIDLEDFFPTIDATRVSTLFRSTGVEPEMSDLLARLLTVGGVLEAGLPTSPPIVNAICLPLDVDLYALAQMHETINSRYADDITFSGNGALPPLVELEACVRRHGFEIAHDKTRWSRLGQSHYVTGLSVSDPAAPHVPTEMKRSLRQELYYAKKFGLHDHLHHLGNTHPRHVQEEVNRLDGEVKYVSYHEPQMSAGLKTTWAGVLKESGESRSFKPKNMDRAPFHIFVDEAEFTRPSRGKILALGMSVSQRPAVIYEATEKVLSDALADPFVTGRRKILRTQGLHFSQISKDVQTTYIKQLKSLPYQGYVAMAPVTPDSYEATYLDLLKIMITRRLMAAESQAAIFLFEENSKVRKTAIEGVIQDAFNALKRTDNRRPETWELHFVSKPNLGVPVPDFLLGVLGLYLAAKPEKENEPNRDKLMFESLRDKYRLIYDAETMTEYSRRRDIKPWCEMVE